MRDLLLVVPSRGRPGNIKRLAYALANTCAADTQMIVGVDCDDPARDAYRRIGQDFNGSLVAFAERSDLRQVVAWTNFLAAWHAGSFRAVGHIGDDNVPRTKDWDAEVLDALEITPFAFANDLYPREPGSLSCHIFTRSENVEKLGYLGPPSIKHMFVDPVWMAWGRACGITYLHDVVIEHLHRSNGKAPDDQTYRDAASCWDADLAAYREYCRDQLNADIVKLGGKPYTPEGIAQFNASLGIQDMPR